MLQKRHDGDGRMLVTFRLRPDVTANAVCVVGDFNGWSCTGHRMTRDCNGFATTIPLEVGQTYRFRYLLDGHRWQNDWAADTYLPNEYGGDDSVIDLTNGQRQR